MNAGGLIQTKVFCVLSDERAFSSEAPAMFSAIMKKVGVEGRYVPFMVKPEYIGEAMKSLKVLNIAGASILPPYKEAIIPYLDALSEGAQIIGAVNTVVHDGETLKGYNTNAIGFMNALEGTGFDVAGKSILIFGTGGTSRAVGFMLNWLRAGSIIIVGRNKEKTLNTAGRIGGEPRMLESFSDDPISVNMVINATNISNVDESPELAGIINKLDVRDCDLVIDLNYGRRLKFNFWRSMAKEKDIKFMDGLLMLAHQARTSFSLWTGIDVEPDEFLKVIDTTLTHSP